MASPYTSESMSGEKDSFVFIVEFVFLINQPMTRTWQNTPEKNHTHVWSATAGIAMRQHFPVIHGYVGKAQQDINATVAKHSNKRDICKNMLSHIRIRTVTFAKHVASSWNRDPHCLCTISGSTLKCKSCITMYFLFIPPRNEVGGGGGDVGFTLSVCLPVRLSLSVR